MNKQSVLYLGNFSMKNFAATNRALGILSLFDQLGFDLHINYYGDDISSYEKTIPIINKIVIHHLSFKKSKFYYSSKDAINIINNINNLSLVVLYNYPSIPSMHIMKLCKKKGIKVIGDISEWYDTSNISVLLKPFKKIDTSIRMRSINKRLDGLIVISDFLQKFYKNQRTIKIYPLFNDINRKQKWGNEGFEYTFGYAGVAGKKKDDLVGFLNDLVKTNNLDGNFLLMGDINKKILNHFEKLNVKYTYLGRVPHEYSINNLLKCRCQVIFRKSTRMNNAGFPTKFAESIYLGIPIICNCFSDLNKFDSDNIFKIDQTTKTLKCFFDSSSKQPGYENRLLELFQPSSYVKAFSSFIDEILTV